MANPHILALPYPAQGHVIPLMELCLGLANHGCKITFVNTDFNHKRVVNALTAHDHIGDKIRLVSIPDGLELWEDRNHLGILSDAISSVMPGKLEELIERINKEDSDKITCVIADMSLCFGLEVALKMKTKRVGFWPAATTLLAIEYYVPKLIDDGIVKNDGTISKKQMIQWSPDMPGMNSADLAWNCFSDQHSRTSVFELMMRNIKSMDLAEWQLCNTVRNLEPAAFILATKASPVGPLLASNRLGNSAGYFWQEDSSCLTWLNKQPARSVIYIAFGSFTVFDQTQFQELALGLELSKKPFLWVVRPDITTEANDAYPEGFKESVGTRGQMVGWAPQQQVLSHPSIACFISHCGWNSTLEGVSNGVPFLTWPYFADQFVNEGYICDVWKVGLKLQANKNGIITKEEIKNKVGKVLDDEHFRTRALQLKDTAEKSVSEGGESHKNFKNFVEWLKA